MSVLAIAACATSAVVQAGTPPGQDHQWATSFSTTAPNVPTDITTTLTMCTDGLGSAGTIHECGGSVPATEPIFDEYGIKYYGMSWSQPPLATRMAQATIDLETNAGLPGIGPDAGQPAKCGNNTHTLPTTFDLWSAAIVGAPVSMSPAAPGFSFDQLDAGPPQVHGIPPGSGWPVGIVQPTSVVPSLLTLMGVPSILVSREYGVLVVAAGVEQITVQVVNVPLGGNLATDGVESVILFDNEFSNPVGASDSQPNHTTPPYTICAPFTMQMVQHGANVASAGSTSINGTVLAGATDYVPPAPAVGNNIVICPTSAVCNPSSREIDLLLSTTNDDDGDGVNNAADDCPTVPDPAQLSFAGIGLACSAGQGYDNVSNTAFLALLGCTNPATCADIDGDGFLNASDNCPFVANANTLVLPLDNAQRNYDGDGRGDACEGNGTSPTTTTGDNPIAIVKGNGTGYMNGDLPGMVTSGQVIDHSDVCKVAYAVNGGLAPPTVCLAFGAGDLPAGPGYLWQDSNNDGTPDFLCEGPCTSGNVLRDHKADANGDGYSDADEGTPANCTVGSCGSIITLGTAETNSCRNAGRNCGTGAATTWDPLTRAKDVPGGPGTGCLKTLDTTTSLKTTNLAKSDVDLDGTVSILDLSKIAGWFGNPVGDSTDPRWEGNMDGDGSISILDLSAAASNYGRSVNGNCMIQ